MFLPYFGVHEPYIVKDLCDILEEKNVITSDFRYAIFQHKSDLRGDCVSLPVYLQILTQNYLINICAIWLQSLS
jgi:hypothetical protein